MWLIALLCIDALEFSFVFLLSPFFLLFQMQYCDFQTALEALN